MNSRLTFRRVVRMTMLVLTGCCCIASCGEDAKQPLVQRETLMWLDDNGAACRYFGSISSIARVGDRYEAHVNFMVLLTDTLARHAAADADAGEWCEGPDNDYYIVDAVSRVDTLAVGPHASLSILAEASRDTIVSVSALASYLASGTGLYGASDGSGIPGFIEIKGGTIVGFVQSYFP